MDQTLAAVSSLRSANSELRMAYAVPGGYGRCRAGSSIFKAVLCETEKGKVESVKKFSQLSVLNSSEKLKATIALVHSKYNAFQNLVSQVSEKDIKGISSETYFLISESKKEREKLYELCQENGVPAVGHPDGVKEIEVNPQSDDSLPLFTVNTMAPFNVCKSSICGSSIQILVTSPKNTDELLRAFTWTEESKKMLVVSHKEFNLRRNQLLQEFIDPIGLYKFLRLLKKNVNHQGIFKLSLADSLATLGTQKRSSLVWVLSELSRLETLTYLGHVPSSIQAEFVGPSSAKQTNSAVRDLLSKGQFVCGKYKVCPLLLSGLSQDILDKWKQGNATMLTREDFKRIATFTDGLTEQLGEARKQGIVNIEVKDEAMMVQFTGELSEVDMQRVIRRRAQFEEESVRQVILT